MRVVVVHAVLTRERREEFHYKLSLTTLAARETGARTGTNTDPAFARRRSGVGFDGLQICSAPSASSARVQAPGSTAAPSMLTDMKGDARTHYD